jgi:hypothetical protein
MPISAAHPEAKRRSARALEALAVAVVFAISSLSVVAAQGATVERGVQHARVHHVSRLHRSKVVTLGLVRLSRFERARRSHQMVMGDSNNPYVSPEVMVQWSRVAMCEEGGNWHVYGPRFSGGLGISNDNWVRFGGHEFASNASRATPQQQVTVARRIQSYPPDQNGCESW